MRMLLLVGIAGVILGCTASGENAERSASTPVEVELLIFSGRENPRWKLTTAEIDELRRRVRDLPSGPSPEPPGLGYGGFRKQLPCIAASASEIPATA
jgi:hypothetical protein